MLYHNDKIYFSNFKNKLYTEPNETGIELHVAGAPQTLWRKLNI